MLMCNYFFVRMEACLRSECRMFDIQMAVCGGRKALCRNNSKGTAQEKRATLAAFRGNRSN